MVGTGKVSYRTSPEAILRPSITAMDRGSERALVNKPIFFAKFWSMKQADAPQSSSASMVMQSPVGREIETGTRNPETGSDGTDNGFPEIGADGINKDWPGTISDRTDRVLLETE